MNRDGRARGRRGLRARAAVEKMVDDGIDVDIARGRRETEERRRAVAFREAVEARCEAVRDVARRAATEAEEVCERYGVSETANATVEKKRTAQTPPVTPMERSSGLRSMGVSADAEELVKALLQSRREREAHDSRVQRDGGDSGVSSPPDANYSLEKAQLRDELEKIRGEVIAERLTLELLRRETEELREARKAATSSDEKEVIEKLTRTRTQLYLLEDEEARLTEDLEYQRKNTAATVKACKAEAERLQKQLEKVRDETESEQENLRKVKSETRIAADILKEHEDYIEKCKDKLVEVESAIESKSALLRELDEEQGSLEHELQQVRDTLSKESSSMKKLLTEEEEAREIGRKAKESFRAEVERLQEEKRRCEEDIQKSQEALAEAVQLLQLAKETAQQEMSWAATSPLSPMSHPGSRFTVGVYDSAHNTPLHSPTDFGARRLFDDSPARNSEEERAYHRLMMVENAAKDAELRRYASETAAKNAEMRLRRMVDFMNRVSSSNSPCSTPSRPCTPHSMDYNSYRRSSAQSPVDDVIGSLESLRAQLASSSVHKPHTDHKLTWRASGTPREELRAKLDQLVAEIRRSR